jgi:hypothetical protein
MPQTENNIYKTAGPIFLTKKRVGVFIAQIIILSSLEKGLSVDFTLNYYIFIIKGV